jgi:outer membrane protein
MLRPSFSRRSAFLFVLLLITVGGNLPEFARGQTTVTSRSTDSLAAVPAPEEFNSLLLRVKALLAEPNNRGAKQAFLLLKASEDVHAGNVDFDYLLGQAANDAMQPGQAILALERVLLVKPDFLQARAELARAYALAKERDNAQREFETLKTQAIPPDVRQTIDRYLSALKDDGATTRQNSSQMGSAGLKNNEIKRNLSFETFTGFDNNVNFGTALDQWVLAGGLTVTPQAASRPRKSAVFGANLAGNWLIPLGGNLELTAGGQLGMRSQSTAHTLDPVNAEVFAGVTQKVNKHLVSAGLQIQHLLLDGSPFRDALGIFAQWQSPSEGRVQMGAYAQQHQFTYSNQSIRNADRSTIGLTFAGLLDSRSSSVLVGSLYGGKEISQKSIDYLSFGFVGARAALTTNFSPAFRGSLVGSFEKRSFKGVEAPLFADLRLDRQLDLRAALEYDLSKNWQLSPQIISTRNHSTLGPNDYKRTQALLFARYRF